MLNLGLVDALRAAKQRFQASPTFRIFHPVTHALPNAVSAQEVEKVGR